MKIVILGPTGVGKTALSIALALEYDAYIINCDATQVYEGLDIGSGKVKKEEMQGVKHFLLDNKKPNQEYNVKEYQKDGRKILDKYKDKNLIIVGGTGLYATALLYDYRFIKEDNLDLSNYTNEEVYELALKKDKNCKIDKNNRVRLERFIKRKDSNIEPKLLYDDCIFIGLTTARDNLYNIINKRVDEMFANNLVEEVKDLYQKYPDSLILNRAIGYKEVISYLNNEISYEECVSLVKKNSRHYAKRQYTWFNNKMNLKWFSVNYVNFRKTIEKVKEYIGGCNEK